MRFKKKSVIVEAVQFTGNFQEIFDWVGQWNPEDDGQGMWESESGKILIIDTLEGEMKTEINDWIIRGIKGEFYPCKPDIFAATYEKVE